MSANEFRKRLDALHKESVPKLIHEIAQSCASFIAEIDANSSAVSGYLEQRLQPLISMARTDIRSLQALEQIAGDARRWRKGDIEAAAKAEQAPAQDKPLTEAARAFLEIAEACARAYELESKSSNSGEALWAAWRDLQKARAQAAEVPQAKPESDAQAACSADLGFLSPEATYTAEEVRAGYLTGFARARRIGGG